VHAPRPRGRGGARPAQGIDRGRCVARRRRGRRARRCGDRARACRAGGRGAAGRGGRCAAGRRHGRTAGAVRPGRRTGRGPARPRGTVAASGGAYGNTARGRTRRRPAQRALRAAGCRGGRRGGNRARCRRRRSGPGVAGPAGRWGRAHSLACRAARCRGCPRRARGRPPRRRRGAGGAERGGRTGIARAGGSVVPGCRARTESSWRGIRLAARAAAPASCRVRARDRADDHRAAARRCRAVPPVPRGRRRLGRRSSGARPAGRGLGTAGGNPGDPCRLAGVGR